MARKAAKRLSFPTWIERTIHLPLGLSAEPGQITLPIYLREIAAAMADPAIEKITIQKSARIGFSTLLSSLIAYHFVEQPAPVLLVLPAEVDARNAFVAIEEIFDCAANRNLGALQRLGGWKSIRMVMRYAHVFRQRPLVRLRQRCRAQPHRPELISNAILPLKRTADLLAGRGQADNRRSSQHPRSQNLVWEIKFP